MSASATYRPRFGYDIRIRRGDEPVVAKPRPCSTPGCRASADFRAPKSKGNLDERQWLCREHLRAQNERWDFFAGMSDSEIERFRVDAITGHRPTWPLGKRAANNPEAATAAWSRPVSDSFGFFEDANETVRPARATRLTKGQLDALSTLSLEEGATLHEIKARYKELVKRFHPDANGGDRGTEERLKQVIKAYGHLRATKLV